MHRFDREARGHCSLRRDAKDLRGLAHEERPQALAAVKAAVAHGRDDAPGRGSGAGKALLDQKTVERGLDSAGTIGDFSSKIVGRRHDTTANQLPRWGQDKAAPLWHQAG
ncbi:hypothetical protein GCM10010862_14800 [Devosia nitrariae]|uniref:Uncharacterized protein n=1 Tax=Devosia nitrariae TaxID=2071872 RepID=A0ABQ5W337_9HYPH|nr:hypothetical protein GCM10010862_14800 [Devosia nitrariae]